MHRRVRISLLANSARQRSVSLSQPATCGFASTPEHFTFEPRDEIYATLNKTHFGKYYEQYKNPSLVKGHATTDGTKLYSVRSNVIGQGHFRKPFRDDLSISSIGIGTYFGHPNEIIDLKMFNAIIESVLTGGVNVIDTAINYRYQKSERTVGAALRFLSDHHEIPRDQLFICTKAGFIPEDADRGIPAKIYLDELIKANKISPSDVVSKVHCIHPEFLRDQLDRSRKNLGVETIDAFYLHNPAENQLGPLGYDEFAKRLATAFEFCETMVQAGKIRSYGLATWNSFRVRPQDEKEHLSLQKIVELAEKVAGNKHNFKYVQVPINIVMPEAFMEKWQEVEEGKGTANAKKETTSLLGAAKRLNVNVISSSPLLQGAMMEVPLPTELPRSIPSPSLLTTLVGMKTSRHVKSNLEVIQHTPLSTEEFMDFLAPRKRKRDPEEEIKLDL